MRGRSPMVDLSTGYRRLGHPPGLDRSSVLGFARCVHSSSLIVSYTQHRRFDLVIEHWHVSSSPSPPYDVGEMRSESRPYPLNASRVSTSSPPRREHFLRVFQTLISHVDLYRTVALNRDGVIAVTSLRRRGDEIRVTAARSQRVPSNTASIDFLSAAGRAGRLSTSSGPSRH